MVCVANKQTAAQRVLQCVQLLGELQSNPVLQVIAEYLPLTENDRYPPQLLQFTQLGLRGYYHCHPQQYRFEGEHGHFHLFVNTPDNPQEWSHLAGLCMDSMGQPLRWFMVNHWVTGESWLAATELRRQLQALCDNPALVDNALPLSLTENWLIAMLRLYHDEIEQLLVTRDQQLASRQASQPAQDIKTCREVYLLAEQPIDLQDKLSQCLLA